MHRIRFMTAAAVAWLLALSVTVVPSAQTPTTDEEFDKTMKAVGATVGSMRKNVEAQTADAVAADARKMVELQKATAAFFTARKAQDAAGWANSAATHAAAVEKAAGAKDMAAAAASMKELMGTCAQCHTKYRDKAADGTYILKKE